MVSFSSTPLVLSITSFKISLPFQLMDTRSEGKRSMRYKEEEEEEEEEEDEDEDEDEYGRLKRVMTDLHNKRGSKGGSSNMAPSCQVDSCDSDLSQAKQYHRRHKVCEYHFKTPTVLIGGQHQRFCQQCSRFHEVSEFDDSKRSCRRRLAGHNERRRKNAE